jgi:hypothetical protein
LLDRLPVPASDDAIAYPGADDLALSLALALIGAALPIAGWEEKDKRN